MAPRRRGSLALRISLLTAAVALITALIGGGIAVGLIRQANVAGASSTLSRIADEASSADATVARTRLALRAIKVTSGTIDRAGTVTTANPLVRGALTPAEIIAVLAGRPISGERTVDGQPVLVAARPTSTGGLIVLQRRADALTLGDTAIRRVILALGIAVALAVALGLLVAWRLSRPIRHAADAAHALAAGQRDVLVTAGGPSEIAELAQSLNALAANLSRSEDRQREFLLSVSHDLRTPLTAITGYAESLADGMITAGQAPRAGRVMLAEAQRLARLVSDLLDLARLDAQDVRIDVVRVELVDWLGAVGEVWAGRCAAEGVSFSIEWPAQHLAVHTDPSRLRQVLDGLLENALRVTPAGRHIVVGLRSVVGLGNVVGPRSQAGPLTVLEVRDSGPGLTDDDLAVAFDRSALYERYRGVRQVGTGLGLAIVYRLVTRLGGTIEAGHAPEGGARFTLQLPPYPFGR